MPMFLMRAGLSALLVGRTLSPTLPNLLSRSCLILSRMEAKKDILLNNLFIIKLYSLISSKKDPQKICFFYFNTFGFKLVISQPICAHLIKMHSDRRDQSNKQKIKAMKQLIIDFMEATKISGAQKMQLQSQIQGLKNRINVMTLTLNTQEESLSKLKQEKNELQSQIQRINNQHSKEKQQFKFELEQKLKELQKMSNENQRLMIDLKDKEIQISELSKKVVSSTVNANQTHSHVTFLKEQLQNLKRKFNEKEIQHEQEIEQLKDLNHDIKRKFQQIENEYTSILQLSDEKKQYQTPTLAPKIRIMKENIKRERSTSTRSKGRKRMHEERQVNPEMSVELDKIKQQIAAQYYKLNTTKESIMKARVSQTLTRIDTIMSQMSYRMDEESSAYE